MGNSCLYDMDIACMILVVTMVDVGCIIDDLPPPLSTTSSATRAHVVANYIGRTSVSTNALPMANEIKGGSLWQFAPLNYPHIVGATQL